MTDIENKLAVLAEIAGVFNRREITWAVGGSLLLYFKGIARAFNDIDIMVAEADAEKAREAVLTLGRLLPAKSDARYGTRHFYQFVVDGVDVDVMAGFSIVYGGAERYFPLEQDQIDGQAVVNDAAIPLHSVARWRVFYELMDRSEKVGLIDRAGTSRSD